MELEVGRRYKVLYRNYKGEWAWRKIEVIGFNFKVNTFHSPQEALYVTVLDVEREVVRDFKPSDIRAVTRKGAK